MERGTRRFGIGDMLIFIAALGVGISGARALWQMQVEKPGSYWTPITPSWLMAAAMASSIATPLTLACLAFRLRCPRPPRRRLWMQPGAAAVPAYTLLFGDATQGHLPAAGLIRGSSASRPIRAQ
jgi:peptidoglycan/LPS O-acetylase OafA/YrhL